MPEAGADTPYSPWREPRAQTYQSNGNGMSVLSVFTGMTALCGNGVTCPTYHRTTERPDEDGPSPQTPCD